MKIRGFACLSLLVAVHVFSNAAVLAETHETAAPEPATLRLADGWTLQSCGKVAETGEVISTSAYQPKEWYTVTVPTTVVAALVKQKVYPDPTFGMNLRQFAGMSYPVGANFSNFSMEQDSPFAVAWWYRKTFKLASGDRGKTIWLDFNGINYRANIWVNGKQIANLQGKSRAPGELTSSTSRLLRIQERRMLLRCRCGLLKKTIWQSPLLTGIPLPRTRTWGFGER